MQPLHKATTQGGRTLPRAGRCIACYDWSVVAIIVRATATTGSKFCCLNPRSCYPSRSPVGLAPRDRVPEAIRNISPPAAAAAGPTSRSRWRRTVSETSASAVESR